MLHKVLPEGVQVQETGQRDDRRRETRHHRVRPFEEKRSGSAAA